MLFCIHLIPNWPLPHGVPLSLPTTTPGFPELSELRDHFLFLFCIVLQLVVRAAGLFFYFIYECAALFSQEPFLGRSKNGKIGKMASVFVCLCTCVDVRACVCVYTSASMLLCMCSIYIHF